MEDKAYKTNKIIYNKEVGKNVFLMKIQGKFEGKPGQFYMVRSWDSYPLLARPLSICDIEEDGILFLYLVVGKGTEEFSRLKEGDNISTLGPLGNGFELTNNKKAAIIAGGIGLAPMKYLARSLDNKVDLYVGYANEDYFLDEMEEYVNEITISSDNGKVGRKGNVLEIFEDKNYDVIYACGPNGMLEAIKNKVDIENIQLSLESNMACGIGACSGCTISTTKGYLRVCHDGPVFQASEVNF